MECPYIRRLKYLLMFQQTIQVSASYLGTKDIDFYLT